MRQPLLPGDVDFDFLNVEMRHLSGSVTLHFHRGVCNLEETEWKTRGPRRGLSPTKGRRRALPRELDYTESGIPDEPGAG